MIKDVAFKSVCIPLLGSLLPYLSGLIVYRQHDAQELVFSNILFIITFFFIWQCTIALTAYIRNALTPGKGVFHRLLLLALSILLFSAFIAGAFGLVWQQLFSDALRPGTILRYTLVCSGCALVTGLVYEILFLRKEQELDSKIVSQLDLERQYAEMNVLKNELDPHFIFNSLTTLSQLIATDTQKAQLFTKKLAQAYKYLLINKDRELITLGEELQFIDNYFYLLQIRHTNKLTLDVNIDESSKNKIMILPCSLQILLENAIKHNQFTDDEPLTISITICKTFVQVVNNIRSKPYMVESTNIGLRNLSTRYRLTCNRDIVINHLKDKFSVKLPLIKPSGI